MKIIFLSLFVGLSVSASPISIPSVTVDQFALGNTWFWSYYENGDTHKLYSTERYRVVELKGTQLSFELWTLYSGASKYTPSAKFSFDLNQCFQAFNGSVKKPFLLKMYAFEKGSWSKTAFEVSSTAFEEKFNCNSKVYENTKDPYQTIFKDLETLSGTFKGFQQLPRQSSSQIRSFYFYDHPKLRGIAFQKTFNPQFQDFYEMRLTDWQMK